MNHTLEYESVSIGRRKPNITFLISFFLSPLFFLSVFEER